MYSQSCISEKKEEKKKRKDSKLDINLFPFLLSFFLHLVAVVVVWYLGQVLPGR